MRTYPLTANKTERLGYLLHIKYMHTVDWLRIQESMTGSSLETGSSQLYNSWRMKAYLLSYV